MQERLWRGGGDIIKMNLSEVVREVMNALSVPNTVSYRAAKPMARVPKMVRGKISFARSIHCCPIFLKFLLPHQRLCIVKNMCIYTYLTG
jgi:hypothetical protein